ncbi:MAG: hypothetical protein QOJ35_235 [Solirubrobacteraceae bacterium]|nr:hypothetical protein [Solirubrobacteraceae bacterium]
MSENVELEVELPRAKGASHVARRVLRCLCEDRVESDLMNDAELLVSELTTNALLHGEGRIRLRARLDEDRLRAEIVDEGRGFVAREREQIGGWGREIVDDLSSHWGVEDGARAWFELERRARAPSDPPRTIDG